MDEKTLQSLAALASKLGTTAEYLWGVLLKQAPIAGVTSIFIHAVWIMFTVILVRFVLKKTTKPQNTKDDPYPRADWREEGAAVALTAVFFFVVLTALAMIDVFPMTIAALLNPEYWALKQILK